MGLNLVSLAGLVALAGVAWVVGGFRRPLPWRTVMGSAGLMTAMATLIFLVPGSRIFLEKLNGAVVALLAAAASGTQFLFGPLALSPGETNPQGQSSLGFIFVAQVLPTVIFFAAFMALGYHLGLIQPVIRLFARLFRRTLKLSGAEALVGASNIFVGLESATTVGPYLSGMTRSELLTLLTCAMSTVASTTLAVYVFLLREVFPQIAGHLLSASVISIPAAVLVSKLMLPETETPQTSGSLPKLASVSAGGEGYTSPMAALSGGAWDGLKLAAGIATLLVAVLGVVGVVDLVLGKVSSLWTGEASLSLGHLLGWLFTPLTWLLGIESADLAASARILGQRVVLTEVVAYEELGRLAQSGELSPRSLLILSYALCGFAHLASMGIFVGGVSALAPSRREDLGALAFRALAGSTLATLMTGALAGLFYHGQTGVLGL